MNTTESSLKKFCFSLQALVRITFSNHHHLIFLSFIFSIFFYRGRRCEPFYAPLIGSVLSIGQPQRQILKDIEVSGDVSIF